MKLPNGDAAIIEMAKLRDYCLSFSHPRGRHKARVFLAALKISAAETDLLHNALSRAARDHDITGSSSDKFGTRYIIDFKFSHADRSAIVRSCWIVRIGESIPRFVTCFVL